MIKILAIINLIIAVQALFLSFHFAMKSTKKMFTYRLVAFICAGFGLIVLNTYLNLNNIHNVLLQDLANHILWFFGPAFYFFVVFRKVTPPRNILAMHTLPFVSIAVLDILFKQQWLTAVLPFVAFSQMLIYLIVVIRHCVIHYYRAVRFYKWILFTVTTFALIILFNCVLFLLNSFGLTVWSNEIVQSVTGILVFPIFYIAYKEMNTPEVLEPEKRKYGTTPLTKEKTLSYLRKIAFAMEDDKLFLQPDLSLQKLADHINIPSKYVSQLVNEELNLTFAQYLSKFRLEEVKRNLINPEKQHLTIYGIAQEAGFNSSSRFYHLFKKRVGLTPKQFRALKMSPGSAIS